MVSGSWWMTVLEKRNSRIKRVYYWSPPEVSFKSRIIHHAANLIVTKCKHSKKKHTFVYFVMLPRRFGTISAFMGASHVTKNAVASPLISFCHDWCDRQRRVPEETPFSFSRHKRWHNLLKASLSAFFCTVTSGIVLPLLWTKTDMQKSNRNFRCCSFPEKLLWLLLSSI